MPDLLVGRALGGGGSRYANSAQFAATASKLNDHTLARVAELPETQAPPEMRAAIEDRVRAMVLGRVEPPEQPTA